MEPFEIDASYNWLGTRFRYISLIFHEKFLSFSLASSLNATVAGTVCDIESSSSTEIVCVTNSHKPAVETQVVVETEHGNMYPVRFYYFYHFHMDLLYTY